MTSEHTISSSVDALSGPELRKALRAANIPALLMVLVQLTGDRRWMEPPYVPTRPRGLEDNDDGGFPEPVQQEIRAAAFDAIMAWQEDGRVAMARPSNSELVEMLSVAMGEQVPLEYGPMIAEDLGLADEDHDVRAGVEPPPGFRAVIIGAGVSGIAAGVKLDQLGIPYVILERADQVGGTWRDNHYPGAGVDTPNHLYSFSFAQNDWTKYYALQPELESYLTSVADEFGITQQVRFGHEVESAEYDSDRQRWTVTARTAGGATAQFDAAIVISAVGAFSRPKYPNIVGLDEFAGTVVHTAAWDDSVDLTGKRVAVIGNGASAMQLVPAVAERVMELTVYQRSPQWAAPFEKYHKKVPQPVRHLLAAVPLYRGWNRARLSWTINDKVHPSLQKDPSWEHPERAVNAINDGHRRYFTRYLKQQLAGRPDLVEKALPTYPPFGKRMLLDNGWFRAISRDNVHVVTDRIERIDSGGIRTSTGECREFDVIVLATGFDVVQFLAPMDVRGRSGTLLREAWEGDNARAYLGLTVPDYPNFFILYGPNAQTGHGGSLIRIVEIQLRYLEHLLKQMFEAGLVVAECRRDVYDQYNDRVDRAHDEMVWTHPGMDVYYRNARGRVVVNNPFRVIDFWSMSRKAELGDYLTERPRP